MTVYNLQFKTAAFFDEIKVSSSQETGLMQLVSCAWITLVMKWTKCKDLRLQQICKLCIYLKLYSQKVAILI
jgi:hypothetical protein